jgi:hypothetical protein
MTVFTEPAIATYDADELIVQTVFTGRPST